MAAITAQPPARPAGDDPVDAPLTHLEGIYTETVAGETAFDK
ncbi:hypothetical protein [Streptomyces sp. NPDC002758]